jgi:hypothetical protein
VNCGLASTAVLGVRSQSGCLLAGSEAAFSVKTKAGMPQGYFNVFGTCTSTRYKVVGSNEEISAVISSLALCVAMFVSVFGAIGRVTRKG